MTTPEIRFEDLCPKCQIDHKSLESSNGKFLPVEKRELCGDCKKKLGLKEKGKPRGRHAKKYQEGTIMKRGRKKKQVEDILREEGYESEVATGIKLPKVKLDRETKKFIKNIVKQGKKAQKLEARADKLHVKAMVLRTKAATMRAGMTALKDAVASMQ